MVALADLPINRITIEVGGTSTSHAFFVALAYTDPDHTCAVLDDSVTATVGGEPLVIGHGKFIGRMDGYPSCIAPSASLDYLPQVSPSTFEIRDATRTIKCALDAALVQREATLVPPGPWIMSAGQPVTVRWPSAAELAADGMVVTVGGMPASDITSNADILAFTVPTLAPGSHTLSIARRGSFFRRVDCGGIESQLREPDELTRFSVDVDVN